MVKALGVRGGGGEGLSKASVYLFCCKYSRFCCAIRGICTQLELHVENRTFAIETKSTLAEFQTTTSSRFYSLRSVTEGVKTTRGNRLKFRLRQLHPQVYLKANS